MKLFIPYRKIVYFQKTKKVFAQFCGDVYDVYIPFSDFKTLIRKIR